MSVASFKSIVAKVAPIIAAIPIGLLGASILMKGTAATFDSVQTWWNSQQKIRVKGKVLCVIDMTPLSSDETPPDGTAIKNECRVRLYAKNYSKTVKTSKHGTYAFTGVPTLRGIKVEIESAVHRHTHKGIERSVEYMSCDSERRVDHGAETIFGFVKPRKDKGEWHIGPTLYGKPSPTPTPRFQTDQAVLRQ
ncbi:MAG: hypothetical protein OXT69_07890 [Candidatus Poribacteria bacterium]|nr:hypothetical protein [Candidatus Poribacteria bacterium]